MAYVNTMTDKQIAVCLDNLGNALQKLNAAEPEPDDNLMNNWHEEAQTAIRSMMAEYRHRLETK